MPPLSLIGRDAELEVLTAALAESAAGHAATIFLTGEAGVGKTRLATSLADAASRQGFSVARGQAFAVELGVPYAIFTDALLPLLRGLDPGALTVLTRGATGDLAAVLPSLFAAAPPTGAAADEAKARTFWSVAQLIGRLCARRPLLLVLDNLQWADDASMALLHFLARQAHAGAIDGHLMILAAHADDDRDVASPLSTAERSLVSVGAARSIRLSPLSREQTTALLAHTFEAPPATVRDLAAAVHDWTRGNPFFIDETLKSLIEAQQIQRLDGTWTGLARPDRWQGATLTPSRSVSDVVLSRAVRLTEFARALLDASAVLGGRVRASVLRAIGAVPEPALLDALDELCRGQWMVEITDTGDVADTSYDFSHPLVRSALYDALGRARARAMHDRISAAFEHLYAANALAHADELAFHHTRAERGPGDLRALRYLVAAGRQAIARHADAAATEYLEPALRAIERSGERAATTREHLDVLVLLARARQRLGEIDVARVLWQRAFDDAKAAGDSREAAAIARRIGLIAAAANAHAEAIARYDAGLSLLASESEGEPVVLLHLARADALHAIGRREEALTDAHTALAIATRLDKRSLLARAHRALLLLHTWSGPSERAKMHGEQAAALAAESGDASLEWSVHRAMAVHAGLTGDTPRIAHHLKETRRLAEETRSPVLQLWTADVEIEYLGGIGEWQAALAISDWAIPAARALGQRTLLPRLLVWTGLVHRGLGDLAHARSLIEEAWALSGATDERELRGDVPALDVHALVPAHTGMAGYLMTAGENERALAIGEAGLALADRAGYVAWGIYRLLPFIIETALYLEDYERAKTHNARLRRDAVAMGHPLGLAWADTTDALLTLLTGDPAEAVPLLRSARLALEQASFVFDAARLRRLIARALSAAGDTPAAARELQEAHAIFERLGAARELRTTREELRAIGARVPPKRGGSGEGALSSRELEIARLVAARKSNKEIGTALDISSRTVSTHLSNIFTKLGVTSRGELADRMREHGPTTSSDV
ncbi:MAG TPA: AAA family ATPase [Gemmatimonadaceae bacterium]